MARLILLGTRHPGEEHGMRAFSSDSMRCGSWALFLQASSDLCCDLCCDPCCNLCCRYARKGHKEDLWDGPGSERYNEQTRRSMATVDENQARYDL